tara:strand:- start:279 stop:455 length:177 start_codon:yes stop_codon:yes gene_type:complete
MVQLDFVAHHNSAHRLACGEFGWLFLAGITGLALTLRGMDGSVQVPVDWHDYCIFMSC